MRLAWFGTIVAMAIGLSAMTCSVVQAGDVGRAKRDLMFAKDNAESGRWDDLDTNMKKAATDMEGLSDAEKAPLVATITEIRGIVTKSVEDDVTKNLDKAANADAGLAKMNIDRAAKRLNADEVKAYADPAVIEKLRAKIAGMTGGSTPAPATPPKTTTTAPPNGKMSDELVAAAAKARSARNIFEQAGGVQDYIMAEGIMHDANKRLDAISDPAKAPIVADMAALGREIDDANLKLQRKEEFDRVDSQVHRYILDADNGIQGGVVGDSDRINKAQKLLESEDVKTYMDADHIQAYQTKIDALRVKFKAHNKAMALQRAGPILKELEEAVAADPFKGTDDASAYKVFNSLKTLSDRVRAEFKLVPKDDPEARAYLDRLAAANAKIEASANKYAVQKMQEQFAAGWKLNSQNFAGWETETLSADSVAQRRVEGLPKTTQAVSATVYWLSSADTKATAEKYKTDAVVTATLQTAQKTLDDASAKLNEAFNSVIAESEHQPMPTRESDRAAIGELARNAADWFAGTKYKEINVARASALDAKWKADVARAENEMAETLKKLTAEADAAWPQIQAASGAERGFTPAEARQWKGKTVLIKGYYNRSGWDFDAAWNYAVDIKGIPVAGNYDPRVKAAFDEGSSHTKFGINDHIGWDVIAVVEGPGQIRRRVNTEVRDKDTHELIMTVESYVPEPCVVLRIIGLHAGPVAVGPK